MQRLLVLILAMTAGYVDGYGLLALNTFLSFMSGNTTLTGANLGRSALGIALPPAIAIVSFVVGVFLGHLRPLSFRGASNQASPSGTAVRSESRNGAGTSMAVGLALAAASIGLHFRWLPVNVWIAVIAGAMGVMNSLFSRIGNEPVSLAFVTGTLNQIGRHLAMATTGVPLENARGPRDTHLARALLLFAVWTSFFAGAILAGLLSTRMAEWTLLPAAAVFLSFAVFSLGKRRN